ncbi:MAG: hypothetical protein Kow00109_06370 [Acidobacteriota bacterium]
MSEETKNEKASFKVEDRRKLSPDGELLAGAETRSEASSREAAAEARQEVPPRQERGRQAPPAVDFSGFIVSLATSAMACLGDIPDPATGKSEENLEGAQQMIDILSMLQAKTKGNLEPDEERLLDDLLYELRMRFLTKKKVIQL